MRRSYVLGLSAAWILDILVMIAVLVGNGAGIARSKAFSELDSLEFAAKTLFATELRGRPAWTGMDSAGTLGESGEVYPRIILVRRDRAETFYPLMSKIPPMSQVLAPGSTRAESLVPRGETITAERALLFDEGSPGNGMVVYLATRSEMRSAAVPLLVCLLGFALGLVGSILIFVRAQRTTRNAVRRMVSILDSPDPGLTALRRNSDDIVRPLRLALTEYDRSVRDRSSASERRYQSLHNILLSMNEGLLVIDLVGKIRLINESAIRLLDVNEASPEDLETCPLLERIHIDELWTLYESVRNSGITSEIEIVLYRQPTRTLHVTASWLRVQGPDEEGVLMVLSDISTIKHLELVRTEFVANVSHELKTPVTALVGFAETLLEGAVEEPETARKFVGIMHRQAQRLQSIIEDLLTLSSLEQMGGRIAMEESSIPDLVTSALELVQVRADEKHSIIKSSVEVERFFLNRHLVEQALINLAENAVKYSPEGSQITVRVYSDGKDGTLTLEVKDNGPGIPVREQSRLFERFYRVDKARSRSLGGTGLGLAIVRHIALIHGGSVRLSSTLGHGSTFFMEIPKPGQVSGEDGA